MNDEVSADVRAATRDFPTVVPVPVRWGDMDAFQHVNNVVFFQYFEQARIAYFQNTILPNDASMGLPERIGPILASTSCRFRAPVTHPDTLQVGARVTAMSTDRFTMSLRCVSEQTGRVVAEGDAVVVSYDYENGEKAALPDDWVTAIEEAEGRPLRTEGS